ncbi:leukotriene B4 receptor 1-like [Kryptolebias marmoratus]|uniref:leukotriene B4 receptor 1-like n=1 Tax=Kryptolebias marmoratus TaxID=37003 RepID=UPI0007F90C13|nr:leukotriene B4 receptor 1-like [Kryptolebias marmoratus]
MDQLYSTVETSNFSSSPGSLPHPSWDYRNLVPAVALSLCFSVGVPGNISVIILRPNWEHLSSLSQSLMLNLAVSDLFCLLTLPLWIYALLYGWTFSLVSCKLLTYVVYCSLYGSLLTVTGLSIQRYLLVVHQLSCQRIQKRLLLVLLWLVALILSIPTLVVRDLKTEQQWPDCQAQYSSDAQQVAVMMTETVFGFASFFTVALAYVFLRKKLNQAAFFNNPQTTRLITSIIVSFFVLWVPYLTINVLGVAAICLKNEELLKFCTKTGNIFRSLTFVNSCLNPLLYTFTSCKFCAICQKKEPMQENQTFSQATNITTIAE